MTTLWTKIFVVFSKHILQQNWKENWQNENVTDSTATVFYAECE